MHATITDSQTRPLAALVAALRPDWDVPGIAAAIHKARLRAPADELSIALIRLTKRDDLRSPAVLIEDGQHWRDLPTAARTLRPSDLPRCTIHAPETLPCRWCESERKPAQNPAAPVVIISDEQRQINAAGADLARAAITRRDERGKS